MPDDPTRSGPQDKSRINIDEPSELKYWRKKFGLPSLKLKEAVNAVGPSVEKVSRYLHVSIPSTRDPQDRAPDQS